MNWCKRNFLLAAALPGLVVLLGTEAWLGVRGRQAATRALAALEQKKRECDWLARQSPALSEANEQAIARDLAAVQQQLAGLQTALQGRDPQLLTEPPPAPAIDLFFDLARFVEKTRLLAARAKVVVRPDERFGFGMHANEAPLPDLVPAVWRQRILGEYLVETLIKAHPRELLSLQRERPLTAAQRAARNQPTQPGSVPTSTGAPPTEMLGQPADFFELNPQLSLRVPGQVDSDAFRLEFTGQTATLRDFVNSLASFKLPLIVRSVEVQPLMTEAPAVVTGVPVPLVAPSLSRFSVVVEFVVLNASPEKPAT